MNLPNTPNARVMTERELAQRLDAALHPLLTSRPFRRDSGLTHRQFIEYTTRYLDERIARLRQELTY